jgi:hypothetical protein
MLAGLVTLSAAMVAAGGGEREAVQACIAASTRGQELRDTGDVLGARAQFRACAAESCPKAIRTDCARWEADVEQAVPSVVFVVREGSVDVADAALSVDGKAVRLDGHPVELNPGRHSVKASKGDAEKAMPLTVYAGERNRLVIVPWTSGAPPPQAEAHVVAVVPPPAIAVQEVRPQTSRSLTGPLTLAGAGVAGVVVFAAVGASGESQLNTLKGSACGQAQNCVPGTTDPVRAKFVAADLGLGVGLAAFAAATLWYLTGSTSSAVSAWSDGRSIAVAGRFAF